MTGRATASIQNIGIASTNIPRECLMIRVKRKPKSFDVIDVLTDLFILRGLPAYISSDNGPEFVAEAVRDWISVVGAKTASDASIGQPSSRHIPSASGRTSPRSRQSGGSRLQSSSPGCAEHQPWRTCEAISSGLWFLLDIVVLPESNNSWMDHFNEGGSALTDLFLMRGVPVLHPLRQWPGVIAEAVRRWIMAVDAETANNEPVVPWENVYCESFNACFRDEI